MAREKLFFFSSSLLFFFLIVSSFCSLLYFLLFSFLFVSVFLFICSRRLSFVSVFFFYPFIPPVPPSEGEACVTLPLSSHAERVGWLGSHYVATRRACPLCSFHHNCKPWEGCGLCRGLGHIGEIKREGERSATKEGRKTFFPCLQRMPEGRR